MLKMQRDNVILYCLRPAYIFRPFDISVQRNAFAGLGRMIYESSDSEVYIDENGRQWYPEDLLAANVCEYFIGNPGGYMSLLESRISAFSRAKDLVVSAGQVSSNATAKEIAVSIEQLCEAYALCLRYVHMANLSVEYFFHHLEMLAARALSPNQLNVFMSSLAKAPSVREAIQLGFWEDTRGTKSIDAVNSVPVVIFSALDYPSSQPLDRVVGAFFMKGGKDLARYSSLRLLTPLAIQLAEEFRHADYSVRTHLKSALRAAASVLQIDPYEYSWNSIVKMLRAFECRSS